MSPEPRTDAAAILMTGKPVNLALRRILPILALCLLVAMIDRSNVAVAALRMRVDLGLSGSAFGLGAGVFYIAYIVGGIPANVTLVRIGARRCIAGMLIFWGVAATAMGFVRSANGFYELRFLLGLAEAGFFPAVAYFLGQWFDRRALSRAMGLFIAMAPASVAISMPITTALVASVGWRWMFIAEGLPALLVALFVWRALPDRIADAHWLSGQQKAELSRLLVADNAERRAGSWRHAIFHAQVWLLGLQYFCLGLGAQALVAWLPQILHSVGMSPIASGLCSTAPWLLAAVATPWWTSHAARKNERYWHAIFPCIASTATMIAGGLTLGAPPVALMLLSFSLAFGYMAMAAYWGIPRVHVQGNAAAAAAALTNSFGNLAGFVAPVVVGLFVDERGGFSTALIVLALPGLLAAASAAFAGRMADPRVGEQTPSR